MLSPLRFDNVIRALTKGRVALRCSEKYKGRASNASLQKEKKKGASLSLREQIRPGLA